MPLEKIPKFLRIRDVRKLTGLPQSSVYALMADGVFPRPIKLSVNRVAWVESEVQTWIRERIEAGRAIPLRKQTNRVRAGSATRVISKRASRA